MHSIKRSLPLQTQQSRIYLKATCRCCGTCRLLLPSANMPPLQQGLPVACIVRVAQDTVQMVFVEWHGLIFIYEPDFTHLKLSILAGSAISEQTIAVSPRRDRAAPSAGHDSSLLLAAADADGREDSL